MWILKNLKTGKSYKWGNAKDHNFLASTIGKYPFENCTETDIEAHWFDDDYQFAGCCFEMKEDDDGFCGVPSKDPNERKPMKNGKKIKWPYDKKGKFTAPD